MKTFGQKTSIKDRKYVKILGIDVLGTELSGLLTGIESKISHNEKFSVFTPNPELVLLAKEDTNLKRVINSADFNIPDGIALLAAEQFLNLPIEKSDTFYLPKLFLGWLKSFYVRTFNIKSLSGKLTLIKGRQVFVDLIKLAAEKRWKVLLLGGLENEALLAAKKLTVSFPGIQIKYISGPILNNNAKPVSEVDIKSYSDTLVQINMYRPQMLFVAFGNPKQEIWINENLSKLKINMAMAVGGTFRYLAGLSKLPPRVIQLLGLEWLWRLVTEPHRIKRVLNAVFVFPVKVFSEKINS